MMDRHGREQATVRSLANVTAEAMEQGHSVSWPWVIVLGTFWSFDIFNRETGERVVLTAIGNSTAWSSETWARREVAARNKEYWDAQ